MSGKVTKGVEGLAPIDPENSMSMSADEINFLIDCLKYPVGGGSISIDTKAVAEARGQKNAGSVANRITKMKKKYNLPIGANTSGVRKFNEPTEENEPKIPITPSKNRVKKSTRGRAIIVKKNVKAKFRGYESDGNDNDSPGKGGVHSGDVEAEGDDVDDDGEMNISNKEPFQVEEEMTEA